MSFKITVPILLLTFAHCTVIFGQEVISKDGYAFTFKSKMPCTEVKNQASTGTCWSFSTGSFLESEAMRNGKEDIDLSEMFWVRKAYVEKAEKYLRYHGFSNFGQGGLSHDVMRLYAAYGAMPETVYSGLPPGRNRHNHDLLVKEMKFYLDSLVKSQQITPNWKSEFNVLLDRHLGSCPENFKFDGKHYNAQTFAKEKIGIEASDYVTITSFSHHELYRQFVLEVPDNFSDGSYLNVNIDDLKNIARRAFDAGHTIVWDCDVSEKGFSAKQGLALVPDNERIEANLDPFSSPHTEMNITAEMRQVEFDNYSLTDDHLMHIVGRAQDQTGQDFYFVKNSWGPSPGFNGYLFASEAYVLLNTIGMTVHKDMVTQEIGNKLAPDVRAAYD